MDREKFQNEIMKQIDLAKEEFDRTGSLLNINQLSSIVLSSSTTSLSEVLTTYLSSGLLPCSNLLIVATNLLELVRRIQEMHDKKLSEKVSESKEAVDKTDLIFDLKKDPNFKKMN